MSEFSRYYRIIPAYESAPSSLALDIAGSSKAEGAKLVVSKWTDTLSQKWFLFPGSRGFQIWNHNSLQVLDVGSTVPSQPGAKIHQRKAVQSRLSQEFQLFPTDDGGQWLITSVAHRAVFEGDGSQSSGVDVIQGFNQFRINQLWSLVPLEATGPFPGASFDVMCTPSQLTSACFVQVSGAGWPAGTDLRALVMWGGWHHEPVNGFSHLAEWTVPPNGAFHFTEVFNTETEPSSDVKHYPWAGVAVVARKMLIWLDLMDAGPLLYK